MPKKRKPNASLGVFSLSPSSKKSASKLVQGGVSSHQPTVYYSSSIINIMYLVPAARIYDTIIMQQHSAHTQLAEMGLDEILCFTAVVVFYFYFGHIIAFCCTARVEVGVDCAIEIARQNVAGRGPPCMRQAATVHAETTATHPARSKQQQCTQRQL